MKTKIPKCLLCGKEMIADLQKEYIYNCSCKGQNYVRQVYIDTKGIGYSYTVYIDVEKKIYAGNYIPK
jgi:hypothetical protein